MAKQKLTGSRPYKAWEKEGQTFTGILKKIEASRSADMTGKFAVLEDEDGEEFSISAPTILADILESNLAKLVGEVITVTWTATDEPKKRGQKGVKRFEVEFDDGE